MILGFPIVDLVGIKLSRFGSIGSDRVGISRVELGLLGSTWVEVGRLGLTWVGSGRNASLQTSTLLASEVHA